MLMLLTCLAFMIVGYVIGLLQGGIRIIHENKQEDFTGYNEPIMDNMPPEVQKFFDDNYGNIGM